MFNPYNPQMNIERLKKQKEEIDNLINNYQNMPPQQPINNIINSTPTPTANNNFVEWRILNDNEEVDNLYVNNKTLFISDKNMVLKDVDGKLEKWEIKKIYPIDKKDEKITELENKIKEMENKLNEYTKSNKSTSKFKQPNVNDDGVTKSESEETPK